MKIPIDIGTEIKYCGKTFVVAKTICNVDSLGPTVEATAVSKAQFEAIARVRRPTLREKLADVKYMLSASSRAEIRERKRVSKIIQEVIDKLEASVATTSNRYDDVEVSPSLNNALLLVNQGISLLKTVKEKINE